MACSTDSSDFSPAVPRARWARAWMALLGCVTLACAALPARAQVTVNLSATKDATLVQDPAGALANGGGSWFFAGTTAQATDIAARRALLQFNFSGIPAGSIITSVQLTLNMSRTGNLDQPVTLHRVLSSWTEGTSNPGGGEGEGRPAANGDVTWLHRTYPGTFWTTPGGDYSNVISANTSVGYTGSYVWSDPGLIADVQQWLNDPATNFGWMMKGNEAVFPSAKRFDSRTGNITPKLSVTYVPPGTVGACCLPNNQCASLTPAQCAAQSGTFQGLDTPCTANLCSVAPLTGACCLPNGSCSTLTSAQCAAQSGTYQGDNIPCATGLCPVTLTPFVDALPFPANAVPVSGTAGGAANYAIAMTRFRQQLHRDLPPTLVYGYGGTFPGPTIRATRNLPVNVQWINNLRDDNGVLLAAHDLPVDLCLHGPDYAGAVPRTVVHLHGGHVPSASDGHPDEAYAPGNSLTFLYPNNQKAATLWYHDHAVGITRLNMMMGLAGFYIIRDPAENSLSLPPAAYDVPLLIQDRTFNADGSFKAQDVWREDYFGDTMLVNGKVWPFQFVARGKYRYRLLNGCNSRTLTLSLSNGATFHQIATDGGLRSAPLPLTSITLAPAERADVIIDFAPFAPGTEIILQNTATAPFPGEAGQGALPNVMKFIVGEAAGFTGALPATLTTIPVMTDAQAIQERQFVLRAIPDGCTGQRWTINGLMWDDITEFPRLNTTEVWSFVNRSPMSHPMHIHLVHFQVLDRQAFTVGAGGVINPTGPLIAPDPTELGWKDTVQSPPNMITRVIMRFENYTGAFAYHCHLLEHEDHEMMRQFVTLPPCATADFNGDGDTGTDTDIEAFFACLAGNCCPTCASADFDADGDTGTDADIEAFFRVLAGQPC